MKNAGAEIVSRVAVDKLMDWLEEYGKALATCALDIAKHSNRKKITYSNVWALKILEVFQFREFEKSYNSLTKYEKD